MKKLTCLILLLLLGTLAFGQSNKLVPTCNSFDSNGAPIYSSANPPTTTGTTLCTDFFGVANYANSPLPVGPVDVSATGFTVMNGGSGYSASTTVTIDDFYATPGVIPAAGCAPVISGGVITGITSCSGGGGYRAPVVTITDTGGGSGAVVLAKLASATSGGIRKFVDTLSPTLAGLTLGTATAIPAAGTAPASDYYEIALVENTVQMHSDLPPTTVRGYVQLTSGSIGCPVTPPPIPYLGPVILAQKNKPVRVKFTNCLPTAINGGPGNLFIPADNTYMGAGVGPDGVSPYLENRATLHLHGGATPWISDGTPHQWTVPVTDFATKYNRGASTRFVPDMWFDASGTVNLACMGLTSCAGYSNDPGAGSMTFYWTNQQGGRLMFYHDHAYGITRLNVYVGEAAGYLLADPVEEDALSALSVPGTLGAAVGGTTAADVSHVIPLVIQDRTFVPDANQVAGEDPTWIWGSGAAATTVNGNTVNGDLWFNHVYPTNQNPADMGGANAFGRWDYGPWFFPPMTTLTAATPPTAVTIPCTSAAFPGVLAPAPANNYLEGCPIIQNPSGTPEGFMDTPLVNGKAYPVLHLAPAAYRFQILSVGNDRSLNLSWYLACSNGVYTAAATNCAVATAAGVADKELPMVPAVQGGLGTAGYVYPDELDGRIGGVPDAAAKGPSWVQIGTEGGLLPNPVVIPPTPVGYEYNRRSITVTNVSSHGLLLGPAERADAVVDFSGFAGKTLILYNDSPAPIPAFDSRIDYFTGDLDQVTTGGAPTTLPGYGPNTRTVMQVVVDQTNGNTVPFSAATLTSGLAPVFKATQPIPIVPEPTYPVASGGNSATATYGRISDNTITFTPVAGNTLITTPCNPPSTGCVYLEQKAIQELFTTDWGRMNATMGVELPLTNFLTQTTIPYGYIDWPTEILQDGATQIWKLTHNGVDTHFIHFHLFNVQVLNRIGWDGAVKPPDANELGWKETVRMNPLEDVVFALTPVKPNLPWPIPDSIRPEDTTTLVGNLEAGGVGAPDISGIDPVSGNALPAPAGTTNANVNFGWEYVWHCHILGHEENDMMRPLIFQVAPPAPSNLTAVANSAGGVTVSWVDNSASETFFTLQRDTDPAFPAPVSFKVDTNTSGSNFNTTGFGQPVTFVDSTVSTMGVVYYRVQAQDDFTPQAPLTAPFLPLAMASAWVGPVPFTANPIIGVQPAALNFGNVLVGVTGGPQSITVSNTGTTALTFNSIAPTGLNAGEFGLPGSTTPCGASLAVGGTCTIDVNFTPTAIGAQSATVTILSNDPVNGTLNVSLTGLGIANTATAIIALPITYGADGVVTVSVTSPQVTPVVGTVTLSVDGGAPLSQALVSGSATFTLTTPPAGNHTLAANYAAQGGFGASSATGTLTVNPAPLTITPSPTPTAMIYGGAVPSFTPVYSAFVLGQGPANLTGTVTCTTNATSSTPVSGNPYSSSCTGATSTNYAITYVPGVVTINQATSATTITSHLPNPSIVGQIVTVNFGVAPQFTGVPTGTATVTASTGEKCSATLSAGAGSCTLTFSTGGLRTLTAGYAGDANFVGSTSAAVNHAVSGLSLSTFSLLFGNQLVGTTSAAQTVTLSNVGTTTITGITFAWSANFSDTNNCGGSLAPGRSCRVNVRFTPTTTGVLTGALTITDSDPTSPQIVTLTGTGVSTNVVVSPISLTFNSPLNVTSAVQTVTVTNTGTAPLTINNVTRSGANAGQFANNGVGLTPCTPYPRTLQPNGSCTIDVTFTPTAANPLTKTATLNVNLAAPATSQTVALTGNIIVPTFTVSQILSFGNQARNTTSAPQTVTVTNTGTVAALIINNITRTGANPNQFQSTNVNCPIGGTGLAAGASCTINVTFRPTSTGPKSANFNVNVAAPGTSQSIPLSGTGI